MSLSSTLIEYVLVYDARDHSLMDASFPLTGALIFGVVLLVRWMAVVSSRRGVQSWSMGRGERWSTRDLRRFTTVMAAFAFVWTVGDTLHQWASQHRLQRALREGSYVEVEGAVASLMREPAGRGEVWTVESGGKTYEYRSARSEVTPGYRNTISGGGVVREGLVVRIADVDGWIARLEVER